MSKNRFNEKEIKYKADILEIIQERNTHRDLFKLLSLNFCLLEMPILHKNLVEKGS